MKVICMTKSLDNFTYGEVYECIEKYESFQTLYYLCDDFGESHWTNSLQMAPLSEYRKLVLENLLG